MQRISVKGFLRWLARFITETVIYLCIAATLLILYLTQPVLWNEDKIALKIQSNPAELHRHVHMLSVTLPGRRADAAQLESTSQYIFSEFSKHTRDVRRQNFDVDGERFNNVIAKFGKHHKEWPLYVIGAHYDSEYGNPGADDNASGVAALLELARLFKEQPPEVPVELVAFALEEPPHFRTTDMGSYHYARSLYSQERQIALMISLEMVGYFRDEEGSQSYPLPGMDMIYPNRGDFIALVGRLSDPLVMRKFKKSYIRSTKIPFWSINAPALLPGIDFSDHLNFWAFDFPAIMITDTAFYRNQHYHEVTDTIEKLDFNRMSQVVDGIFGVLSNQ